MITDLDSAGEEVHEREMAGEKNSEDEVFGRLSDNLLWHHIA